MEPKQNLQFETSAARSHPSERSSRACCTWFRPSQGESKEHIMSSDHTVRNRAGNQDSSATVPKATTAGNALPDTKRTSKSATPKNGGVGVMDILRILGGLFLLNCLLSYFITNDSMLWGWRPWFVRPGVVMRYLVSLSKASTRNRTELTAACSKVLFP